VVPPDSDTPAETPEAKPAPRQGPKPGRGKGPRGNAKPHRPDRGGTDPMDVERLERIVELMVDRNLSSIELQDGQRRIALTRGGPSTTSTPAPAAPAPAAPAPAASAAPAAPAAAPAPPADNGLVEITSPMVGTFYASPKPGAPAFVSVGSSVKPDTDVCIIEAMKVFNTIKADAGGTIEKLLVKDGDAVEFGQALFLVRPG